MLDVKQEAGSISSSWKQTMEPHYLPGTLILPKGFVPKASGDSASLLPTAITLLDTEETPDQAGPFREPGPNTTDL